MAIKLIIGLVLIGYVFSRNTQPGVPILNSESYEGPSIPIQSPSGLIYGGFEVTPHEIPWQTYISSRVGRLTFHCGGAIIANNYVLTAAHCIYNADEVEIVMGAHNITANEPSQVRRVITNSDNLQHHEKYRDGRIDYDIALIKLDPPLDFNEYINLVPLNTVEPPMSNWVMISGWGKTGDEATDGYSDVLRIAGMLTASDDLCKYFFDIQVPVNYDSIGCLGNLYSSRSTCDGDSGGPVIYDGPNGMALHGTVAFQSPNGCGKGYPVAYTSVLYFHDWITEKITNKA